MAKKEKAKEPDRILIAGKPDLDRCNNEVVSARYTALNFIPVVRVDTLCCLVSVLIFSNESVAGEHLPWTLISD